MRILYNPTDGTIFYAVPDKDWFYFTHSTNLALATKLVDELAPQNQIICQNLFQTIGKVDANGRGKYYIDGSGNIVERSGWIAISFGG